MKGIVVSPGIAIGQVFVLESPSFTIDTRNIEDIDNQIRKLKKAVELSRIQLELLKQKMEREFGADKAEIIGAHLMILGDTVFLSEMEDRITADRIKAENAASQVGTKYAAIFMKMEDEYLRERSLDIKDVVDRLIKNLLGISVNTLEDVPDQVIIVAKDLTPSDTAQMNKEKIMAIVTEMGGKTSHTAIMARSLEIPAVTGLINITSSVKNGDWIIVDGNKGEVFIKPSKEKIYEYRKLMEEYNLQCSELKRLKDLPAITKDGMRTVMLSANIGTPNDIQGAVQNGAEGVGLYRTEFIYMNRNNLPTEEEQYEAYKIVVESMKPNPVIVRTLDIGGDKKLPYLDMPEEMNPFLGCRAIRFCLANPNIFKTQLRAILRASSFGNLKIMYPMISGVNEVLKANAILAEAKRELQSEGISFNDEIQVGIMVEIPAAAVEADILAKLVDFFSIGTNDLIQYTLAVDRMNTQISNLYEPFHPAVLRLIKGVIDASHREGKWTGMCGEMAGEPAVVPILLGMGLDELSMSSGSIPIIKKLIRSINYKEAVELVAKVLEINSPEEIKNLVQKTL